MNDPNPTTEPDPAPILLPLLGDQTLEPAALALYALELAPDSEQCPGGIRASELMSAAELELVLSTVRAVFAEPVLAHHRPCCERVGEDCLCINCGDEWPCPTLRALGVKA